MNAYPYIIAFLAIACYATQATLFKKIGTSGIPPFTSIAVSMLMLSAYGFIISVITEKSFNFSSISTTQWGLLAITSLTNFLGFWLFLLAVKNMPIAHYQLIGLLTPIIGGIFAYCVLKEPMHWRYLIALAFMGVGLWIAIKPNT